TERLEGVPHDLFGSDRGTSLRLLEVSLLESELESPDAWVDVELSAPRHCGQRAGQRTARARHQAVLSGLEGKLAAGIPRKECQGRRPARVGVLVQIDHDRPGRPVDESSQGHGWPSARTGLWCRHDPHPRRGWAAVRALDGLTHLLLLDGYFGEAERGHAQEEASEVLAVAVRNRIAWPDRKAGAAREHHEYGQPNRRDGPTGI